jgi:LPXTG-motif cell wall-anchored protein
VATNISPDSKITTSYGEGVLPQPRVNVKAKLELNDKNVTIYKGDDVPSAETVLNDMVQNYAKNTGKYGVATDSFSVNWYTAEALEKKFDASTRIEDLKVIGTKVENDTTYYLTVTYDAGAPTDESNANTTENGEVKIAGDRTTHTVVATSVNDSNRTYGIYNIHVISGTIKITKKLVDLSNEDQTFTFVVKKDSEIVATVPLTVRKGEKEASFTGDVLTNLPRGTYTVEEQNTSGYVLNEAKSGTETNCENSVIPTYVARFVLGNSKATENVIKKDYTYDPNDGGTVGQAVFTNEKVITDWDIVKVSASSDTLKLEGAQFTLKDSNGNVRYTGTSNANGKIEWKEKGVAVSTLAQGTYECQETKAPAGYSVSAEKWTILIASNGYLKSIKKADGTEVIAQPTTSEDSVVHYYYEDNALYELPHTGGPGIYLFTIGGILLMGAAAWILYKNKCREVLKR